MNLESSKTLGGYRGAILVLVGAVAFFFDTFLTAIALIGLILIVVAMKGLADYYKENGIFTGTLLGFIVEIVGGVVTAALAIYIVFFTSIFTDFVHQIYPGLNGDWSSLANMTPTIDTSTITPQSTAVVAGRSILDICCFRRLFFRSNFPWPGGNFLEAFGGKIWRRLILNQCDNDGHWRLVCDTFRFRLHHNAHRLHHACICILPTETAA